MVTLKADEASRQENLLNSSLYLSVPQTNKGG